ncbi:uncharacterized protein LOC113209118 isoform X3 [Frankliniella occidentalis]|uniref:Uncharacterized protein LOC113209118 isoform X3 n=1 Tax=Frankliniella occidentalis TaxID=133901 RepID=A0A9C6TPN8_FRAOC|nr:uncharacterized protein LOC113209118 isoform X3 [Frankliniella occidentalis]
MPGLVPGSSVRTLRTQRSDPGSSKKGPAKGKAKGGKASWPPARDVIASAKPKGKTKGKTEDKSKARPSPAAAKPVVAKQPASSKPPGKPPSKPLPSIGQAKSPAQVTAAASKATSKVLGPAQPPGAKHGVLPALSRPPRPPRVDDGPSTSSKAGGVAEPSRASRAPVDHVEAVRKKPNGTAGGAGLVGRQGSLEQTPPGAARGVTASAPAPPEIHDTAFGGSSSDEDDIPFPFGHESAAANALLYVGLGTVAVGMVIAFVGTGEKGFKTLELRLIGPTLIAGGVLCCLLRVMLCVCPSKCLLKRFRQRSRHKKQIMALEAAGRIAMGPMGRNIPPRHGHHGMRGTGLSRSGSRAGSKSGSRPGSRPPSRVSRAPSELIRSPSDPNDPTQVSGLRGKKRVSIASASAGPSGSGVGAGVHRPGSSGLPSSQSSQVLAATSLFLQNEQQTSQAARSGGGRLGLGFTVPSINLPTLVRGRTSSEDLGDGYKDSGVRRLSQSSKHLGSTGDLPLLAAVDVDADGDGFELGDVASCSFNSAFSPDDSRPGPSSAQSTSLVHAPHAIIVTSPTPSSSPRPATRTGSAGSGAASGRGGSAGSSAGDRDRPAREIILSPGGLGLQ